MKKKASVFIYPLMMGLLIFSNSCEENNVNDIPLLTTVEVTEVTATTAISGGNITDDGGTAITARGVCWSKNQTPSINDSKTTNGKETGSYTSKLTGLTEAITYYVRAYATNSNGTAYGNAITFQTLETDDENSFTDPRDNNKYKIVTIGNQIWMTENLKATKYNDGTSIPLVTDNTTWDNLTTPAYCWYNNDSIAYAQTYGVLYNWHTVNTSKLCPKGWHVPSDAEWTTLITYLGGESVAGGKLKETGTTHWLSPNKGATNETGFTALPGGYRTVGGAFTYMGDYGRWWSTTEHSINNALYRYIYFSGSYIQGYNNNKKEGYSVRCIKD